MNRGATRFGKAYILKSRGQEQRTIQTNKGPRRVSSMERWRTERHLINASEAERAWDRLVEGGNTALREWGIFHAGKRLSVPQLRYAARHARAQAPAQPEEG